MKSAREGIDVIVVSRLSTPVVALLSSLSRFSSPHWVGRWAGYRMDPLKAPVILAAELVGLFGAFRSREHPARPVVMLHYVSLDFVAAYVFRLFTGCRLLLYAIGSDIEGERTRLQSAFLGWAVKEADLVMCANREIAAEVRSLGGREVAVLPPPFEESPSVVASEKIYDVVSVGVLSEVKRQGILISSLGHVSRPLRVALVGDGPLREALEEESRRHPASKVSFLGKVSHDKVSEILSKSRVYVQCSKREGIPLSVLEAAWAGLPVVVIKSGYARDLVELYGLKVTIVEEQGAEALAAAVEGNLDGYKTSAAETDGNLEALVRYSRQWSARAEEMVRAHA